MKLPHKLVPHSRLPSLFGHQYMAAWPFILLTGDQITPESYAHEYRHCIQQVVAMLVGAVVTVVAVGVSSWLLFLPLWFLVPYWTTLAVQGYQRSWFEADARRWAERNRSRFP